MSNQLPLNNYPDVLEQLKADGYNMEVHSTNYTKRIKLKGLGQQMIFSDGKTNPYLIKLIESLRLDADNFNKNNTDSVKITSKKSYEIDFYGFIDRDKNNGIIKGTKIDINSAYWTAGLNMGLISDKSNEILEVIIGMTPEFARRKEVKGARLKSLGSLATRKIIYTYEEGKLVKDEAVFMSDKHQLHRSIYLTICEMVAELMAELIMEFFEDCIYYYWDCLFIREGANEEEIFKRIEALGFTAKVEGRGTFEIDKDILNPTITFTNEAKDKVIEYPISQKDLF